jgi:hypothetical protein
VKIAEVRAELLRGSLQSRLILSLLLPLGHAEMVWGDMLLDADAGFGVDGP